MNRPLETLQVTVSYSEIRVRFHLGPPIPSPAVSRALNKLSELCGCIAYSLAAEPDSFYQWVIAGFWTDDRVRDRHYSSPQIQVLFQCLIQSGASVICCSQGRRGCREMAKDWSDTQHPRSGGHRAGTESSAAVPGLTVPAASSVSS